MPAMGDDSRRQRCSRRGTARPIAVWPGQGQLVHPTLSLTYVGSSRRLIRCTASSRCCSSRRSSRRQASCLRCTRTRTTITIIQSTTTGWRRTRTTHRQSQMMTGMLIWRAAIPESTRCRTHSSASPFHRCTRLTRRSRFPRCRIRRHGSSAPFDTRTSAFTGRLLERRLRHAPRQ